MPKCITKKWCYRRFEVLVMQICSRAAELAGKQAGTKIDGTMTDGLTALPQVLLLKIDNEKQISEVQKKSLQFS